jgi:hypothetical protein
MAAEGSSRLHSSAEQLPSPPVVELPSRTDDAGDKWLAVLEHQSRDLARTPRALSIGERFIERGWQPDVYYRC